MNSAYRSALSPRTANDYHGRRCDQKSRKRKSYDECLIVDDFAIGAESSRVLLDRMIYFSNRTILVFEHKRVPFGSLFSSLISTALMIPIPIPIPTPSTSFAQSRLPPEVNRILYVRNLPFKISAEELYGIFGKYGAVYQIRLGDRRDTRGTAFVIYEDIFDAKAAVDHLSGFNVGGRYLVVLYYQPAKFERRQDAEDKQKELEELRRQVKAKKASIAAKEASEGQ